MARPRRFPNGQKTVMLRLPPEVIEAFEAKGGREWLMQELGFDFGPPSKTYTSAAKKAKNSSQQGWSVLLGVMTSRGSQL